MEIGGHLTYFSLSLKGIKVVRLPHRGTLFDELFFIMIIIRAVYQFMRFKTKRDGKDVNVLVLRMAYSV